MWHNSYLLEFSKKKLSDKYEVENINLELEY